MLWTVPLTLICILGLLLLTLVLAVRFWGKKATRSSGSSHAANPAPAPPAQTTTAPSGHGHGHGGHDSSPVEKVLVLAAQAAIIGALLWLVFQMLIAFREAAPHQIVPVPVAGVKVFDRDPSHYCKQTPSGAATYPATYAWSKTIVMKQGAGGYQLCMNPAPSSDLIELQCKTDSGEAWGPCNGPLVLVRFRSHQQVRYWQEENLPK